MSATYLNRLPHLTPKGRCFFVTFCTQDSIPIHASIGKQESDFIEKFANYDRIHDLYRVGINLATPPIAQIISTTLLVYDNNLYELLYYCIMPNHVHLVIDTGNSTNPTLFANILKFIKGRTSREINIHLKRTGTFWQKASYDRMVRNEKELASIGDYILENPVKVGLLTNWEEWPYTYWRSL